MTAFTRFRMRFTFDYLSLTLMCFMGFKSTFRKLTTDAIDRSFFANTQVVDSAGRIPIEEAKQKAKRNTHNLRHAHTNAHVITESMVLISKPSFVSIKIPSNSSVRCFMSWFGFQ